MRSSRYIFLCVTLFLLAMWPIGSLNAQAAPTPVQCGTIIESEVTAETPSQDFVLRLSPGTLLDVRLEAIGQFFNPYFDIINPQNEVVWRRPRGFHPDQTTDGIRYRETTVTVSGTGNHIIRVEGDSGASRFGAFILYITCTPRNGTPTSPFNAVVTTSDTPTPAPVPTLPPDTPGFPGLAPVDMSNAVKLPLIVGTPMTGIVTPTGNEILGFSLEAEAGDTVELSFRKLSGNLNLGVVVLSPDNRVVFYGGLVLSDSLSTRFTLQGGGQYTIGVFRVDLLPPAAPEATAFQVQGAVV